MYWSDFQNENLIQYFQINSEVKIYDLTINVTIKRNTVNRYPKKIKYLRQFCLLNIFFFKQIIKKITRKFEVNFFICISIMIIKIKIHRVI